MRTFLYTGDKDNIEVQGQFLHRKKPYETDNARLIAALEARAFNFKDVKELTPKA